jgi:hypothetical protein
MMIDQVEMLKIMSLETPQTHVHVAPVSLKSLASELKLALVGAW